MRTGLIFLIIVGSLIFSANTHVLAQSSAEKNDFLTRTTFRFNTTITSQESGSSPFHYATNELFYQNYSLGFEMDYAITKNISINAGLTYTGSSITDESGLFFGNISPDPNDITNFKTDYQLTNFAFEPKAKVIFGLHKFDFIWSAGPIVSLAYLSSDMEGASWGAYLNSDNKDDFWDNPTNFSDLRSLQSHSLGFGWQVSTGTQYFLFSNLGISAELGYRYLTHNSLHQVQELSNKKVPIDYTQRTFFHRFGIVIRL